MRRHLLLIALLLILPTPSWAAVTTTFLQTAEDETDTNVYTFSDQNIGTASADRCVVVAIGTRRTSTSATTIDSVTIEGNAADILYQQDNPGATTINVVAIATLIVTSGTTADIVVTVSATMTQLGIALYGMTGVDCDTLADSDFSEATDPSVSLDVPDDGASIAVCGDGHTASTTSWTGLTEDYDNHIPGTLAMTGASDDFADAQSGLTMTCDLVSAAVGDEIGIFVSFSPTAAATTPARVIGGGVF